MFKLTPVAIFACGVMLSRPESDRPIALRARFRHKTQTELEAWSRSVEAAVLDGAAATESGELVFKALDEVIVDLAPLADERGDLVPYSSEVLRQLLAAFPSAATELASQYRRRLIEPRLDR